MNKFFMVLSIATIFGCAGGSSIRMTPQKNTNTPDQIDRTYKIERDASVEDGSTVAINDEDAGTVSDAGFITSDAGQNNPVDGPSDDTRVAVAYCAAAVLDELPNNCSFQKDETMLITVCDTGLMLTWTCEKCGAITLEGELLGHLVMHSDKVFQINPTKNKQAYLCTLNDTGTEFIVKEYR